MLTTREALTGPWASNVRGWLGTAVPSALAVGLQELATGYRDFTPIVVSFLAQFLASGAWAGLVATLARRRFGEIPPPALVILWVGIGVVRGVVGGAIAAAAGLDPEFAYRIVFWGAVACTWMPLSSYLFAQAEEYRRLLTRRAELAETLAQLDARHTDSDAAHVARAREAIGDAFGPALDEIRAGLDTTALDPSVVDDIRARVDELSSRARSFTMAAPVGHPRPRLRVSLAAAMNAFQLQRPIFAGALTLSATAPFLVLEAFRVGSLPAVGEMVVGLAVATAGFVLLAVVLAHLPLSGMARLVILRAGTLASGGAGAATIALLSWHWLDGDAFLTLAIFPLLFAAAAEMLTAAVGLEAANAELGVLLARDEAMAHHSQSRLRAAEERASARLLELVRGDISGKLASCAMALAFLSAGTHSEATRRRTIDGILDQIDAASARVRELDAH